MVESIHRLLNITVPYQNRHVIACTREYVGMERREFYTPYSQLVTSKYHYWRIGGRTQIPYFDCIVSACCSHKVFIFVKVHTQNFVAMSVDSLHVFS